MTQADGELLDLYVDALRDIHLLMNGAIKLFEDEGTYIYNALRKADLRQARCAFNGIGQALYLSLERTEKVFCKSDFLFGSDGEQNEEETPSSPL